MIDPILIIPEEIPKCPICSHQEWLVKQRIEKESFLKRVDQLNDLVVEPPDPNDYLQSLVMECIKCETRFQPMSDIAAKLDAYVEGTESLTGDGELVEGRSGEENGFGWQDQVTNQNIWEEGDFEGKDLESW